MQSVNLPLFEYENTKSSNNHAQSPEDKLVSPLTQVLEHTAPEPLAKSKPNLEQSESFKESLNNLFPEQKYEDKDIQKAKQILGKTIGNLKSEEIRDVVAEVNYLVNTWLDDFEREIFDGQTLKEHLHEKGSL